MARAAISSSSVQRKPPSPALITLAACVEKHATSAERPAWTPSHWTPRACAQSSTTFRSNSSAISYTACMLVSLPRMCVSIRYLVSGVMRLRTSSVSITYASVHSMYSGTAPAWWIAEGTAVNEKALASTASPGCTPRHFRAMKSAEPHELKPTQYLKPVYSERAASASATSESTPGWYRNSEPALISSSARWRPASGIGSGLDSGLWKGGPSTPPPHPTPPLEERISLCVGVWDALTSV
mmetsp:Transcript_23086/g.60767  ORF Transcript_23086/g.60767 Transcript_23086/m.60767 type:complete len:240 (+) Transcript_23086:1284-2003(+)